MRGESARSNPWVAKGERTQMIKAAIVGLGWWAASSTARSPPARNASPMALPLRSLSDEAIPRQGDCEV